MRLFLLIVLLIPEVIFAQTKMNGIADLKIGYTSPDSLDKKGFALLEKAEDDIFTNPKYIDLKNVKVFYADNYNAASVLLSEVYLYFYNDSLYKIDCQSSSELSEAMNLKYGKGTVKMEEKEITCRNGLGATFKKKEKTFIESWKINNPSLECISITALDYDRECKEQTLQSFTVYTKKKEALVEKLIKKKEQEEEAIKKTKRKKEIDGF